MKLFEREDRERKRFEATIHGFEIRFDTDAVVPGQTHRRTGLRSFHDRIARRVRGGR